MQLGMNTGVFTCAGVCSHLDLAEVNRSADQLIVLRELFTRWKLDKDFTQLPAIAAARPGSVETVKHSNTADSVNYHHCVLLFYFCK